MLVALFALLGLVVDGGRAMAARQAAQDEAEQAARAGAGALSVESLRSGQTDLDPQAAVAGAESFTLEAGHPGTATVAGGTVTVTVSYPVPTAVLGLVGISSISVSATASAFDVHGVSREDP
jgi:Flp pilus assembly protein TadG